MSSEATHEYEEDFFEYINAGSLASARVIVPLVIDWLRPQSLLDVGCGAGAWCQVWRSEGVDEVIGVDGDYVRPSSLLIPPETFHPRDLSGPFDLSRSFDLVTSLEVAEHVPAEFAEVFVQNLARHGNLILFSAAVPGQGGEFHVNEQPLSYWRDKFAALGFRCFDPLRPRILHDRRVEPWYRYNTILYARHEAMKQLPPVVRSSEIEAGMPIPDRAPWPWCARKAVIRRLPRAVSDGLVRVKHAVVRARRG